MCHVDGISKGQQKQYSLSCVISFHLPKRQSIILVLITVVWIRLLGIWQPDKCTNKDKTIQGWQRRDKRWMKQGKRCLRHSVGALALLARLVSAHGNSIKPLTWCWLATYQQDQAYLRHTHKQLRSKSLSLHCLVMMMIQRDYHRQNVIGASVLLTWLQEIEVPPPRLNGCQEEEEEEWLVNISTKQTTCYAMLPLYVTYR